MPITERMENEKCRDRGDTCLVEFHQSVEDFSIYNSAKVYPMYNDAHISLSFYMGKSQGLFLPLCCVPMSLL